MRRTLLVFSLLPACASVALVAQMRYVTDAPGRWKPWSFTSSGDDRRLLGTRPADMKSLEGQLLRLNEIVKGNDAVAIPIGFSVETSGVLHLASGRSEALPGEPALTARPLPAILYFGAFPIVEYGTGSTARREDGGETALLAFFVNDVTRPVLAAGDVRVPEFEKLDTDVVRLAAPEPDLFGLPRYGKDTIVIKKTDAPISAPVSLAEALDLVARSIEQRLAHERDAVARLQAGYDEQVDPAKREQRLAEHKQIAAALNNPNYLAAAMKAEDELAKTAGTLLSGIAQAKAVVAATEQELAAARAMASELSAEEKAAPACYAGGRSGVARFRRAPESGCTPLVRPNWSLFNPALPRSAPQLLTISQFARCLDAPRPDPHPGRCTANMRLLESIGRDALLAWLQ